MAKKWCVGMWTVSMRTVWDMNSLSKWTVRAFEQCEYVNNVWICEPRDQLSIIHWLCSTVIVLLWACEDVILIIEHYKQKCYKMDHSGALRTGTTRGGRGCSWVCPLQSKSQKTQNEAYTMKVSFPIVLTIYIHSQIATIECLRWLSRRLMYLQLVG